MLAGWKFIEATPLQPHRYTLGGTTQYGNYGWRTPLLPTSYGYRRAKSVPALQSVNKYFASQRLKELRPDIIRAVFHARYSFGWSQLFFGAGGTFFPALRASDNPIAIACFGLVTFLPLRPLFSWPFFIAFISVSTLLPAAGLYFRVELLFFVAVFFAVAVFFVAMIFLLPA
jgi:hypothetical protein